ncbi:hypothetical protein RQP46_008496 [Phenoliferia psychrophenolica]
MLALALLPSGLLLLASVSIASPLPAFADLGARDETSQHAAWGFTPVQLLDLSLPVTFPTAGTVWQAGGQGYITWNQSLPSGVSQSDVSHNARLVLGYTSDSSVGLHLDVDHPLGTNIPLYNSTPYYAFTLPSDLPTRSTYILSFQGSSGNLSPEFTIEGLPDVASSSSPSPPSSTSTPTEPIFTPQSQPQAQPQPTEGAGEPVTLYSTTVMTYTEAGVQPAVHTTVVFTRPSASPSSSTSSSPASSASLASSTGPAAASANAGTSTKVAAANSGRVASGVVVAFATLLGAAFLA